MPRHRARSSLASGQNRSCSTEPSPAATPEKNRMRQTLPALAQPHKPRLGLGTAAAVARARLSNWLRLALSAFDGAQFGDVLLMLFVAVSEHMTAGAVGDEIDFFGTCRICRGFE